MPAIRSGAANGGATDPNPLIFVRLKAFYLDPARGFLYLAGTRA
jgi:hypothetical protein